jgi:outer membrane lipoprotein-sorting protein
MKTVYKLVSAVLLFTTVLTAQEMSAEDIINKVDEMLSQSTSYARSEMIIITTSGEKRTFIYDSWSKDDGEKNLVRYLEPKRVKGQATLMLNHADDIWMYFPRTNRVRKLASHAKKQKMQGSDFSYEDMGGGDSFLEDYAAHRLTDEKIEEHECFKIELVRKEDSDISYSRLVMWIIMENYYPLVIDYYDENDPQYNIKRLVQSNIEMIDGYPTARQVIMYNKADNTQTEMKLLEVTYNLLLDDKMFTERELKK